MKNAKRMLALAGMTLAAGAMLGITPAQAAPATTQAPSTATAKSGPYYDWDDQYVVGYYNNERDCRKAGWWGERRGAWSDYDCFPAWGYNNWGRVWVLQVEENDWRWDRWDGGWPRGWDYRPTHYGRPFNVGGGGYNHPFADLSYVGYDFPRHPHKPYHPGSGYPGGDYNDYDGYKNNDYNGYKNNDYKNNDYNGYKDKDYSTPVVNETSAGVTAAITATGITGN
ncbi:hypothetical protein [Actinoplanes derwentensis]|uniref:YXWGXW repeat-containing protein n=1 Tax=Actinoplanes derwentensis TaxID=113562 RepID=A0A1H1R0L4_9ACTN|nr:hypothetical protein [Actinoplanes derwentensis]GID87123.1 hypothetical protein Ade03nite_60470 [Actinoplanes derwentensis]SDS29328.1 hypothetical protein SAMN04489716_0462 [Actinoplanes derwentensis]